MRAAAAAILFLALAPAARAMMTQECSEPAYVAKTATVIVKGEVLSVEAKRDPKGSIWTYVRVKVGGVLKGKAGKTVTIREFGGALDGVTISASETPAFKAGEKGFLYLERQPQSKYYGTVCASGVTAEGPR